MAWVFQTGISVYRKMSVPFTAGDWGATPPVQVSYKLSRTCPTDPRNKLYFLLSMKVSEKQTKRVPASLTWLWALKQKENTEGEGQCPQKDEMRGWGRDGGAFWVPAVEPQLVLSALSIHVAAVSCWAFLRSGENPGRWGTSLPWSGAFHTGSRKADPSKQDQPKGSAGLWVTQGTTEALPESTDTNSQPRTSAPDFVTEPYKMRIAVAQMQHPAPPSSCAACPGPSAEPSQPPADPQRWHRLVSLLAAQWGTQPPSHSRC